MKHNPTAVEDSENTDLTNRLGHVAEEHSFEPSEETTLTLAGECPHCGKESYETRHSTYLWMVLSVAGLSVVAIELGFTTTGAMLMFFAFCWLVALGSYPKRMHKALSRVGL